MNIIYSAVSDKGLKRPSNQDSIFSKVSDDKRIGLFVIADGMGGHYMGELASTTITSGFSEWWKKLAGSGFERSYEDCIDGIKEVIGNANSYVYENYTSKGNMCGSTFVLLFIYSDKYFMMNVGDSRLYSFSEDSCMQLSFDHTVGSAGAGNDKITPKQAVGKQYVKLKNNRFLLCTDGLYKNIPAKLILKLVKSRKKAEQITNIFIKTVFSAGAPDNVSIIVADIYDENYKPPKKKLIKDDIKSFIENRSEVDILKKMEKRSSSSGSGLY